MHPLRRRHILGKGSASAGITDDGVIFDGHEEPPVVTTDEVTGAVTIRGKIKDGYFGKFIYPIEALQGNFAYNVDMVNNLSGLTLGGARAGIGFGFRQGNKFKLALLQGDGAGATNAVVVSGEPPNGWNKQTGHTTNSAGAPTSGTQHAADIQLVTAVDGTSFDFKTSGDDQGTWDIEFDDQSFSPFADLTEAAETGIAGYFHSSDTGEYSCVISWSSEEATAEVVFTFTDSAVDASNLTEYTFSAMEIGTAHADREVYVGVHCSSTISTVTVGGVSASRIVSQSGAITSEIWKALVPTETTADIVVTAASPAARCAIAVGSTSGLTAHYDADGAAIAQAANASNVTLDTVDGGFIFGYGADTSVVAGGFTWRNMTERVEETIESNTKQTAADGETTGASTEVGVDRDGETPGGTAYVVVAKGPLAGLPAGPLDGTGVTAAFSLSRSLLQTFQAAKYLDTAGAITRIYNQVLSGDVTDGATSTRRPALATAFPNSITCADFDGSSDYLDGSAISNYIGASSKFIVATLIFDSISITTGGVTAGHAAVVDSTGRTGIFGYNDGADKAFAANFDGTVDGAGVAVTEGTAYVVTCRHDGTNVHVSINGGAETSVASGATSGAMGTLRFGYRGNGFFDGKLAEAALWSTVPDESTRNAIIADFMAHAGIT